MKTVLISIQPKWCELIASGKKTIEVRKTAPKLQTPFKCYIYCTKSKEVMFKVFLNEPEREVEYLSGKVIGEFVCDRIDDLRFVPNIFSVCPAVTFEEYICKESCLTFDEIKAYKGDKAIYGWHISDLKIYDTPKELWEFKHPCPEKFDNYDCSCGFEECKYKVPDRVPYECDAAVARPFRSWGYVEEL